MSKARISHSEEKEQKWADPRDLVLTAVGNGEFTITNLQKKKPFRVYLKDEKEKPYLCIESHENDYIVDRLKGTQRVQRREK